MTELCTINPNAPIDSQLELIQSEKCQKELFPQAPKLEAYSLAQPKAPYISREIADSFVNLGLAPTTQYGLGTQLDSPVGSIGVPAIPMPIFPKRYNMWVDQMKPGQQKALGYWNFTKGALSFAAHDLFLYNRVVPASNYTNHNFVDPSNPDQTETMGNRFSPGMTNWLLAGEGNDILVPMRNVINTREMLLTMEPLPHWFQGAEYGFMGLRSVVSMHHNSKSNNAINPPRIDKDDFRVQMAKDQSDLLNGMTDAQVAQLLSDYQASGDFGSHQDAIWYFQNILGVEITDETDVAIPLALNAAGNTSRYSPDGALLALLMTTKAQAARANTRSAFEDVSAVQYGLYHSDMNSNIKPWFRMGTALTLAGAQIAAGSFTEDGIHPSTIIDATSMAGLSYFIPAFSNGNLDEHFAIVDSVAPFMGSKYNHISLNALNYASNRNYQFLGEDVDGDGLWDVAKYKQNPTLGAAKLAIHGITAAERAATGYRAGRYLYEGKSAPTWGHVISLAPSVISASYLSTKPSLFAAYNDIYKDTLVQNNIQDPYRGPINGRQAATSFANVGAQAVGSALGITTGYLRAKKQDLKAEHQLKATRTITQLKLELALKELETTSSTIGTSLLEDEIAALALQVQSEKTSPEFEVYNNYIKALHDYDEAIVANTNQDPTDDVSAVQMRALKDTLKQATWAHARWNVDTKKDYYDSLPENHGMKAVAKQWFDEAIVYSNQVIRGELRGEYKKDYKEDRKVKFKELEMGNPSHQTDFGFNLTWEF